MTRGPRYTDSKDFDEIHDEITTWVMDNYSSINAMLIRKEHAYRYNDLINEYPVFRGEIEILSEKIKVEEQFGAFYPDVKIAGRVGIYHPGNLVLETTDELPRQITFSLRCSSCGNISRKVTIPGKAYDQYSKEVSIRDERDYCEALSQLLEWEDVKFRIEDGKVVSDREWSRDHYCYQFGFLNIIEIKSHIKSFGETMRQLQSYRETLASWKTDSTWTYGQVALITPDTRFNEYFRRQGFAVFTYKHDPGERSVEYFDNDRKLPMNSVETKHDQDLNEKGGQQQ